jgi:hypothetical protein
MFYKILLIIFVASLLILGTIVALYFIKLKLKRQKCIAAYPKDTVILHQVPRGLSAPSASPFVLKLETWFRISGIPYQVNLILKCLKTCIKLSLSNKE